MTLINNWVAQVLLAMLFVSTGFASTANAQEPQLEEPAAGDYRDGVLHLSAEQARVVLANDKSITVLDVRTAQEHEEGRIQAGLNIDYYGDEFKAEMAKLDKDKPYLVHCRSGVRSGRSLAIMRELGFSNILHLDGGYKAWLAAEPAQ